MGMARPWLGWLAAMMACGPTTVVGDGEGGSDTSTGSTGGASSVGTSPSTSAATSTTIGSSTLDTSTGGSTGACGMTDDESDTFPPGGELDIGPGLPECDVFAQDCDEGEKCVPSWFATRVCTPIAVVPIPDGEPCEDGGDDPCGPRSWCTLIDDAGIGTCVPLCQGSWEQPSCPPDTICVIDDEHIVAFCQRPCDPFGDAPCPGETSCQPTALGFGCLEAGHHPLLDPCVQDDSCADGRYCADGASVAGCCHDRCCTPLCSTDAPCETGSCQPLDREVPGPAGLGYCG